MYSFLSSPLSTSSLIRRLTRSFFRPGSLPSRHAYCFRPRAPVLQRIAVAVLRGLHMSAQQQQFWLLSAVEPTLAVCRLKASLPPLAKTLFITKLAGDLSTRRLEAMCPPQMAADSLITQSILWVFRATSRPVPG